MGKKVNKELVMEKRWRFMLMDTLLLIVLFMAFYWLTYYWMRDEVMTWKDAQDHLVTATLFGLFLSYFIRPLWKKRKEH